MHSMRICALCSFMLLITCGCGGGGGKTIAPPPTTTGTISGKITLPENTNAKQFEKPLMWYARIFSSITHAETITDLTKLTVKSGSATTNADTQGKYSLTVNTGTNIEVTVTASSGNIVLMAIVPEIKTSITTTQDIDTESTAVALIYKDNSQWPLSLPQIKSATSSLESVENDVTKALTDDSVDSILNNSEVLHSASMAAQDIHYYSVTPSSVIVLSESGKVAVVWNTVSTAQSYNLYMASQAGVTKNTFSNLTDGIKITGATSPYIIQGLSTEKTYYFVVTSVDYNVGNESLESEETSITPSSEDNSLKTAIKVAAGKSHTCAVFTDETVKCWGSNTYGGLGNGNTLSYNVPITVNGLTNAIDITTGYGHTCALLGDGSIKCWGLNGSGQLGNGSETDSSTSVSVANINYATRIDAGYYHTCAVLSDGKVTCWGWNSMGQLGNDTTTRSAVPIAVSGINNAVSVSAGAYHTCALISDGTVKCWGENLSGQLGNGTKTNSAMPVPVAGLSNAAHLACGTYRSCAVVSGKTVVCWGKDYFADPTGAQISGTENALQVATGYDNTCVILKDKSTVCWKANGNGKVGMIGDNTASLSLGDEHSCTILLDGELRCWGDNRSGQVGGGTNTNSSIPVSPFVNMQ